MERIRRALPSEKPVLATGEVDRQEVIVQNYKNKIRSPTTAIRAFCVSCMGGYVHMVNECNTTMCPLWKFRLGGNPYHGRTGQKRPDMMKKDEE